MKADTLNLKDIFAKDANYVVPMFQRPYVWDEEEHWRLLWEDLQQVVDELVTRREMAMNELEYEEAYNDTSPHFLGAIVLDQQSSSTPELEQREIIDGQQRLITLQVLLSAVHTVARERSQEKQTSMVEMLMYNNDVLATTNQDRLKVWPIEADKEAFMDVMKINGEVGENVARIGDERLHGCFEYFKDQIDEWLDEENKSVDEQLDALVTTVWHLLRVVVIDLESNDDAQVIFETLNARGTPLLAADLIKNYLFREATIEQNHPRELHEKYWEQFDEKNWRQEVSQGRLERPKIDVFIMHWLTMRTSRQVRAKKLFPTFRKYLDQTEMSTEELLQDINKYSDIYEEISDKEENTREGIFFHRLDVLDTTTPYPVLLWIFGEDDIPQDQRVKTLESIESWLIRRMLCRLSSKNYNNVFLELLETLKQSENHDVGDITVEFFRSREGESDYWPSDDDLTEAMRNHQYWARVNQRRLKMVFTGIEREIRDSRFSETLTIDQPLEIEHILPQKWARNWSLPGEKAEEVEEIERDKVKNKIGNLTILTNKLNPSVSNANWEKKRAKIKKHSVLQINNHLVEEWSDEWNEETIAERGEWLANRTSEVWYSPSSSYWDE